MKKPNRKFIHVGDIAGNAGDAGTLILTDKSRFDDLRFPFQHERTIVTKGQIARQVKDETRTPFAVAVTLPYSSDCFFPVYAEIQETLDGQQTVLALRIHLHHDPNERVKAPRMHRKK